MGFEQAESEGLRRWMRLCVLLIYGRGITTTTVECFAYSRVHSSPGLLIIGPVLLVDDF